MADIFEVVGEEFFKPLTSYYKSIYWQCIRIIYDSYRTELSFGIDREHLTQKLEYFFDSLGIDEMQFEDDTQVLNDSRSKSSAFLRKLKDCHWVEYEIGSDQRTKVVMPSYAVSVVKNLESVSMGRETEYGDIALSSALLRSIDSIEVTGSKVVTIENLTTFNAYIPNQEFVVYLGGYHNTARRSFIKKLYELNPGKQYYHFGDIDAGGFYILLHLRKKTGVPFVPLHMDVETLSKNRQYTKKLTENDKTRLKNLSDGEFSEVISYMLKNNCKLEQESLD